MKNKLAAIGLAAGLTAGGGAGLLLAVPAVSGAQSADTTVPADPGTTAPSDSARPDRTTRIAEALAPLVEDGTITQDQADAVASTLATSLPEGHGGGKGGHHGAGLDAAATALGLSAEDLRAALQGGQTIAQVAEANGVDVQTVIDAMVAEEKAELDARVTSGAITQEEADQHLTRDTERITDMVNNGMPTKGDRGPRAPDSGTTDSTTQTG